PFFSAVPAVLFVHDLSALHTAWAHTRKVRLIHKVMLCRALRRAARIITISDFTREDLLRTFPAVAPGRVETAPLGVNAAFARPLPDAVREATRVRLGLPQRFILAVNTLEPRKNVPGLLRAFARLRADGRRTHKLVI